MRAAPLLFGALVATLGLLAGCFDDAEVVPPEPLPADLAVDRPTVQLLRFARGRAVIADTVRISNNGEGPLGRVDRVGGVDYITTARTGWLDVAIEPAGADRALLILRPTYAEEEQAEADVAEIVLKAAGSPELKRVRVVVRTLRGASFEFSVRPVSFAAVPGDPPLEQTLRVSNGGNGTLAIRPPTVRYTNAGESWLEIEGIGGGERSPSYRLVARPAGLSPGLDTAYLVFESQPTDEARAKPDSVPVLLNIGRPVLELSTSDVSFSTLRGAARPPPEQTVALDNVGEGGFAALGAVALTPPAYSGGAAGWLLVEEGDEALTLSARPEGLGAGVYAAAFSVSSGNGGRAEVAVELSVEAPVLSVDQRAVAFGLQEDAAVLPPARTVRLSNTGAGTFANLGAVRLGAPDPAAPWLGASVRDSAVVLTPTDAALALPEGDYPTRVPVRSEHGDSLHLEVALSVSRGDDPPSIALSAAEVAFRGVTGGASPSPQEVQITNSGGGTLGPLELGTVSYIGTPGWLAASLAGTTVTLRAETGALADGSYRASVPVTSEAGGDATIEAVFTLASGILTASTTSLSFIAEAGGSAPAAQTVTFTNTGPGDFSSLGTISVGAPDYSGSPASGWLSAAYAAGTLSVEVAPGALDPGTYVATIPVSSTRGGGVEVEVSFSVRRTPDEPLLVLSTGTLRFLALRGGGDPPGRSVGISNGGGGTLVGVALDGISYGSGAAGWLSAGVAGGTMTLDAAPGARGPGRYEATVRLTSGNGGDGSVDVTLEVAAPTVAVSPAAISFGATEGGAVAPGAATATVSNVGAGTASDLGTVSLGSIVYDTGSGWAAASLSPDGTTIEVSADAGALTPGTYRATVPVSSTAGGNASLTVNLTVAAGRADPVLGLSAATVEFFAEEGGDDPADQILTVVNRGGGDLADLGSVSALAPTYGSDAGWLSSSVAGGSLTIGAAVGSLDAAGSPYTASLPVRSDVGTREVEVIFNVAAGGGGADLEASPSRVTRDAVAGRDPPDQIVTLYNAGSSPLGALTVEGISYGSGSGWLSAVRTGSEVTLDFDISGLDAGGYDATVDLGSANGGTETVQVELTVSEPRLTPSLAQVDFGAQEGGAAAPGIVTVELTNSGSGDDADLGDIGLDPPIYGPGGSGWLDASLAGGGERIELSATPASLPAGSYRATLDVTSEFGGDAAVEVALVVTPGADDPDLTLSADAVTFEAIEGGTSPSPESIDLFNGGGGDFGDLGDVEVASIDYGGGPSGWLAASAVSGAELAVVPETGTLGEGAYTATIRVRSDVGGSESLDVAFRVGAPVLTASTGSLSFTAQEGGGAPAGQTLEISNSGVGSYADLGAVEVDAVAYGPAAAGWLVTPTPGSGVPAGTLSFSVAPAGLAAGTYGATVRVTSTRGGDQDIEVTLAVVREADPPELVLSASSQRFDALVGGSDPPPQTTAASNAGGGSLGTIRTSTPRYGPGASGWLSASVDGPEITTRVSTGDLELGTYTAELPVTSAGGSRRIDVTLVVGTSRLTLSPRTVTFGDTAGGTGPPPDTVTLSNTGGGDFASLGDVSLGSVAYAGGAEGWLEAALVAPDRLRLLATTGAMASRPEPYVARVPLAAELGGSDTVSVAFTVAPKATPPRLALSRDSVAFSGVLGAAAPPAQDVDAFNAGGGELEPLTLESIDYGTDPEDWLTLALTDSVVTLAPDPAGVPAGTHRATVTLAAGAGERGSIEVVLRLAAPVLTLSSPMVNFSDTVASSELLRTQVFVSNTGAGNREALGRIDLGAVEYVQGGGGWLQTTPLPGEEVVGYQVEIAGSAATLPSGTAVAHVPVRSTWGGHDTIVVAFTARIPDRSFDLPTIELVRDSVVAGTPTLVALPGDSVVVGPLGVSQGRTTVRLKVRNGSRTRLPLSGLRVGVPSYGEGEPTGWVTGAFLERTSATFDDPVELFVVVEPGRLAPGRYESRLVVSSESAGLEAVAPRVLRVVLVVR